jgi:uncharacterized protein (DUF1015 family)
MPAVFPFRGIRYAAATSAELSRLIAPPYASITDKERTALAADSPHNLVHVLLGAARPGDGPDENRYSRAAREFHGWLTDGTLQRDPRPAFYALEESFVGPSGRRQFRRGFIGAVRLHDFGDKVIVPHQKTLAEPRLDRLRLLDAARANLSPILGLFEDDRDELPALLAGPMSVEPTCQGEASDGVLHRLWRVEDPATVKALAAMMADKRVLIGDGHHRYEAALLLRDRIDAARPGLPDDAGHRFCLMYLCSSVDPGLVIFSTHRLVAGLPALPLTRLLDLLEPFFDIETLEEDLRRPGGRAWAVAKLTEHGGRSTAFLMVTAEDQKARILTLRDEADLSSAALPESDAIRSLDVAILHGLIFERLLGLSQESQERQENIQFVRDVGEAVARTLSGEYQVSFLLNPATLWQVQAVADAGETLPQKSTFFFPRVAAGLVLRAIDPDERLSLG